MGDRKQPNPPPSERQVKPAPPPAPPRKRGPDYPGMTASGISLRDWFAGHVLANIADPYATHPDQFNRIARDCYGQADAMLKAREK